MNKLFNRKDGFTLVEVIFSIAFLSVISMVILQLLIASYDVENKTDMADIATLYLSNEIENIKLLSPNEEVLTFETYYSENWHVVDRSDQAFFKILVVLEKDMTYERGLYDLKATVLNLDLDEEVMNVTTKHYYNHKE